MADGILGFIKDKMWEELESWLTIGQSDNDLESFTAEELELVKSNVWIQDTISRAAIEMYTAHDDDELRTFRAECCNDWFREFLYSEESRYMNRISHITATELGISKHIMLPY